ncbi:triose-phosphate isomerase [Candidatus Micrarchaeota archaeon]|nr:triose-phosphate isomerase [Candidatus Micrarchaeota archaeon]MBU2476950.1 triose-phosphate isomerase [Candidatus Micrarchaeota archaeon]
MLIAGNWKLNKTLKETKDFFKEFNKLVSKTQNMILVCPSFPCIPAAREYALKKIFIGAQNVFFEEKGEFTGEVSVSQLKSFCDFIVLGHSDRRNKFSESNELINKKVKAAMKSNFNVILCVGETLNERNSSKTNSVLEEQLTKSLSGVALKKLFIAYEPVWAIGTGKNASKEDIIQAHSFIKQTLTKLFGEKGKKIQILYGGSVKPENAKEILSLPNVDGVLVGGASLDPKKFAEIANHKK